MITELNLIPGLNEKDWVINVVETNASAGVVIRPAATDHRHGIKGVTITSSGANKWIEILDGENALIGPVSLGKAVPFPLKFESPIYGTKNCALILKAEDEFDIHLIVKGTTGPPLPSPSPSPSASPSASPSV